MASMKVVSVDKGGGGRVEGMGRGDLRLGHVVGIAVSVGVGVVSLSSMWLGLGYASDTPIP